MQAERVRETAPELGRGVVETGNLSEWVYWAGGLPLIHSKWNISYVKQDHGKLSICVYVVGLFLLSFGGRNG